MGHDLTSALYVRHCGNRILLWEHLFVTDDGDTAIVLMRPLTAYEEEMKSPAHTWHILSAPMDAASRTYAHLAARVIIDDDSHS